MICDEIQCGMGRTGKLFAYENYDILPDIVTCAKAIGGGVTVGAFCASNKFADSFKPGDHGSTYVGNPFVSNAVNTVFEIYYKENILKNVNKVSPYLIQQLDKLTVEYDSVIERRGLGLMQGIVLKDTVSNSEVTKKALEKGLILAAAHGNVVRFLPPLIIEKKHIDEMISILKSIL